MRHGSHELPHGRVVVFADAEARHAAAVWALQEAVLAEGRWFLRHPDEVGDGLAETSAAIAAHSADPGSLFLLARCQGAIVGVLTLTRPGLRRLAHIAHLEVFLSPDVRGQGLGEALLRNGLQWAEYCPQLAKVSLSVYADNEAAVALYQRVGFVVEGHREGEVREADGRLRDDLLMARRVS